MVEPTPRVAACHYCGADVTVQSRHPGEYKVVCARCGRAGIIRVSSDTQVRREGKATFHRVTRFKPIGTLEVVYHRFDLISEYVLEGKWWLLLAYAAITILAEGVTVLGNAAAGLVLHGIVLLVLLFHAAMLSLRSEPVSRFAIALALLPMIRIVSITTPVSAFTYFQWFLLTSAIVLGAAIATMRTLGHAPWELGLHVPYLRQWPGVIALGAAGVVLGGIEYAILRPSPILPNVGLATIFGPAILIVLLSGLSEELVFRGILQRMAAPVFGPRAAILLSASGQALLSFAFLDPAYAGVVLASGILFGWAMRKSGQLVGPVLAHGLANVALFLVLPVVGLPGGL